VAVAEQKPAAEAAPASAPADGAELDLASVAALSAADVVARLGSSDTGLSGAEATRRLGVYGRNDLPTHGVSAWQVLARQLHSPILLLLLVTAAVSGAVGDVTDAVIIGAIMAMSIGLSFFNEYRSEQAVQELHSAITHTASVDRDGRPTDVDVSRLVPGDVVYLNVGDKVPADLRLLEVNGLECDESALTGESQAVEKTADAEQPGDSPLDLRSCAFMGTVVSAGAGRGIVVRTGRRTAFGDIAGHLGDVQEETEFQKGLEGFSKMLGSVTAVMAISIFAINVLLGRSILQSALFSLSIAVGLTPSLLPAIVTVSLATGSRQLSKKRVVVKRLISIEDLGNVQVLCTDKTGTLTLGQISFTQALDISGKRDDHVRYLGLADSDKAGNDLDRALWAAAPSGNGNLPSSPLDRLPFDYERQLASVLVDTPQGRLLVSKGAPERVIARCSTVPAQAEAVLDRLFGDGMRVVAVASRGFAGDHLGKDDERGLTLDGFLCFTDPVKPDAGASIAELAKLGVAVKILTGDNGRVAAHLCGEVGLDPGTVVTSQDIDKLDDDGLRSLASKTTIFSRVTPEQKSRIIRALQALDMDVAYMGDGVNDVIALHDADVGISVDDAVDVAKDAGDVVLLDKDLGVLADGVMEGRHIFANTMKYILMATSSNFGNMFSVAGASFFLSFLPMLPKQILLNNFLYDVSEMTIPTDNVDRELLARPARWDVGMIRRFMAFFGPVSSIFDFITFAVMLRIFHAGPALFHSGWFVESLTTQTLVVFVIRTRRFPFYKSRASGPLAIATLAVAAFGIALPYIPPLAHLFGFTPLPAEFLGILGAMTFAYLGLVQLGVARFFKPKATASPAAPATPTVPQPAS